VAATLALTNAPAFASAPSAAQALAQHTVARAAVLRSGAVATGPRPAIRPLANRKSARPVSYTVNSGDSLSAIAQRFYQDPGYWPVLYWANHGKIQYADVIAVGQVLTVPVKPAKVPGAPAVLAPAPAPSSVSTWVPAGNATSAQAGTTQTAPAAAPAQSVPAAGDGSFQSCVIARESGGNSQVMNSSGHYGLYQFSSSTWAAYGGNPADFGNASVGEQNQVFNNAIAAGGASNWSAYDGC
jgi:LysM repeat protein